MPVWLIIFVGGGFGSVCRWGLSGLNTTILPWLSGSFPLGTMLVNVFGCFAMGVLLGMMPRLAPQAMPYCFGLSSGFLGGFTTFSAFSGELWLMLQSGRWGFASLYASVTILLCLLSVGAGWQLAK